MHSPLSILHAFVAFSAPLFVHATLGPTGLGQNNGCMVLSLHLLLVQCEISRLPDMLRRANLRS